MKPIPTLLVQRLINLHCPAANLASVRVPEHCDDPNDHFKLPKPITTRQPISFRAEALRVFSTLLEIFEGDAEKVSAVLENRGLLNQDGICFPGQVAKNIFGMSFNEAVQAHYSPLTQQDIEVKSEKYKSALFFGQYWGVSIHYADRILWEYGRDHIEKAEVFIQAGRNERAAGLAEAGLPIPKVA